MERFMWNNGRRRRRSGEEDAAEASPQQFYDHDHHTHTDKNLMMLHRSCTCHLCHRKFGSTDELQIHLLDCYRQESKAAPSFPLDDSIRHHSRTLYQCRECSATFHTHDDFQVHTLTEHYHSSTEPQPPPPPPYGSPFSFDLLPPPSVDILLSPERLGKYRGIQGENNSCYLDASLFALFYAHDTWDSLLVLSDENEKNDQTNCNRDIGYCRSYLKLQIVNQLRRRGFVPSSLVFEWRRMMRFGNKEQNFDLACQEEEACEFIRFLLDTFGSGRKDDASLCCSMTQRGTCSDKKQGEDMLQLLVPSSSSSQPVHTVEQLLYYTMTTENLVFNNLGKSLILQLPRYGKKERILDCVMPSTRLQIQNVDNIRQYYELSSILVIGRSHFVSYIRIPHKENENQQTHNDDSPNPVAWLYFDSMADRVHEQNIPITEDVTEQLQIFELPNASYSHLLQELSKHEHLRRVVQDLSMALYRRCERPNSAGDMKAVRGVSTKSGWINFENIVWFDTDDCGENAT